MSLRSKNLRFSKPPRTLRALIALIVAVALLAPMNFVLITPGTPTKLFPKVLTIDDPDKVLTHKVNGQLYLLTIFVTNPETQVVGASVLGCWVWGDCVVVPRSAIYQRRATNKAERAAGTKEMKESQNLALVAAKRSIARYFPEIDLSQVTDSSIKVSLKNTGGPSGGIIFTLGLIDLLTPQDILAGRKIAGTGTIDGEGKVGAIGGVTEKIIGAKRAGAEILFISQENCGDLPNEVEGIEVVAVESIDQVVGYLLAAKSGENSSPQDFDSAGIRGCASVGA
jgi:PDZ domain-containing protein